MASQPIFHTQTQTELMQRAAHMPHALGLHGEKGVGLLTAATYLSKQADAQLHVIYPEKNDTVDLEKGSITIDIVRKLYTLTQGKTSERRCIVVTAADTMSHAAQNAFLKLLEEPTQHTTFILLSHQPSRLLATVRSRLQMQAIRRITRRQSEVLLDSLGVVEAVKRQQLLFIAEGLPAELTKLAGDDAYFEAEASLLRQARTYIQGTQYERLRVAQALKGSRSDAVRLVNYAIAIIKHDITVKQTVDAEVVALLEQLVHALERLEANGNPRLVLAEAVLE